jgi:hypothetical protein
MIVLLTENGLQIMRKEAVVAYLAVLFFNLTEGTEKNYQKPRSGQQAYRPRQRKHVTTLQS